MRPSFLTLVRTSRYYRTNVLRTYVCKRRHIVDQPTSQRDGERIYLCIDLKTFYASVECVDRGLDTLKDNLVVADTTRGRGTICLAITSAMKRLGIRNRCRIFEIPSNVRYTVARPRMRHYMEGTLSMFRPKTSMCIPSTNASSTPLLISLYIDAMRAPLHSNSWAP